MCGIAGIYQLNGRKLPIENVGAMGRLMTHRGPDNFTFVGFERVGIAHNRLSLLDLSPAANQPYRNDRYILSYNGEIYNFRQLKKELIGKYGAEFSTASDTEVLFYSLIYEGVSPTLKNIQGMFAFSFYDRANNELWLARDRLGIKPLYYFQDDAGFYWSSEIKALAQTLNLKLDPLKTLFSLNGIGEKSSEYTLFAGVKPVKPGTFINIKSGGSEPKETVYYRPIDDFEPEVYRQLEKKSAKEIVAEFDQLLDESVEKMLVSDAPLGAFASGGLDSSLLSAIAAEKYSDFKLFTANVVGKFSEYEDAHYLARHIKAPLFDYKFEPEMMLAEWADVTYFYETPIIVHTNAVPFSGVARLARDTGVKAVLTGEGADELFLGYPRLLAERYLRYAALPVKTLQSFYKIIPGLAEQIFPPPAAQNSPLAFINRLVQNFEAAAQQEGNVSAKMDFLPARARREQLLTIKMLGDHLVTLLHRNDRMGMMASIEARFPFLDEKLVKFAISLPVKYKIGKSWRAHNFKHPFLIDKWIVRETAKNYLPAKLSWKKKIGFPVGGHRAMHIEKGFFDGGWVAENLSLTSRKLGLMAETQDAYLIAKLASVEIFGRIFDRRENRCDVKNRILKYVRTV